MRARGGGRLPDGAVCSAGSERVGKSEATGDRLEEAKHINKSLSALGKSGCSFAHHQLTSASNLVWLCLSQKSHAAVADCPCSFAFASNADRSISYMICLIRGVKIQ